MARSLTEHLNGLQAELKKVRVQDTYNLREGVRTRAQTNNTLAGLRKTYIHASTLVRETAEELCVMKRPVPECMRSKFSVLTYEESLAAYAYALALRVAINTTLGYGAPRAVVSVLNQYFLKQVKK